MGFWAVPHKCGVQLVVRCLDTPYKSVDAPLLRAGLRTSTAWPDRAVPERLPRLGQHDLCADLQYRV